MKRSTAIILLTVGAGAVAFYALRDPGKTAQAHVFRTVEDCVLSGGVAENACREEYRAALASHETTAPRYTDRASCEAEFGANACQVRPSGTGTGSVFMPLLAGYMFGQLTGGRPSVPSQPLYPVRPGTEHCPPDAAGQIPQNCPPRSSSSSSSSGGTGGSGTRYRTGHGTVIVLDGLGSSGSGSTRTSTGSRTSTVTVPRTVASPPPSRPNTVSRNGFGQTSRSFSFSSWSSGT